ncbi:hypothetical protein RRG08_017423 [Elysia crispata]|uniref:Uncharacterized protein n=1 Tax=Elysia crispata TaxID=231223 RepID=A0AAE1B6S9_9GAST|nr:hypothetical protein RRG08_017423 [Elysia crispata]
MVFSIIEFENYNVIEPDRIQRQLLHGKQSKGKRQQGRPQKLYKDNVKAHIAHAGVPPKQVWAQVWVDWRMLTKEEMTQQRH